jgi:hypothetical protein
MMERGRSLWLRVEKFIDYVSDRGEWQSIETESSIYGSDPYEG